MLVGERPSGPTIRTPPFLCIEILSPSDRMSEMQERIDDYLEFGVPHVRAIYPMNRRLHLHARRDARS